MSNVLVAFLIGVGFAGWVYSKIQRQTGGNTQTSLIAAGASGFVAFLLMWMIMGMISG
ncbi:hypothetical protein KDA00_01880 [Candidatus Saccharibacteria bacterium]|nr:hypothetical protein [Candidatus Saccharibacteria bacterium]